MLGGEFGRKAINSNNTVLCSEGNNTHFVMSGRTAMSFIICDIKSKRNIRSVYMPSYCSRSMIQPIIAAGISVKFYPVSYENDGIKYEVSTTHGCDCIVLMDYFGYCSNDIPKIAREQQMKGIIVICDLTQAFLNNRDYESFSDYTLVSYRKWTPVSVAKVWARDPLSIKDSGQTNQNYEMLRNKVFDDIYRYGKSDSLLEAEHVLREDYQGYIPSEAEICTLMKTDFNEIRKRHIDNAKKLTSILCTYPNDFFVPINRSVGLYDCPLYVPIILDQKIDRNDFHKYMNSNDIEIYIHWDFSSLHNAKYRHNTLFTSEVSLFCDQRYSEYDMEHMANIIGQYPYI